MNLIQRARAYVAKMPPAIAGRGGHLATFAVGLTLTKGFDLTVEEALPIMAEWNQSCQPPWKEGELRHKLHDAARSSKRPDGYLLKDDTLRPAPPSKAAAADDGRAIKARQRRGWPKFQPLTRNEIHAISGLRKLPVIAVELCAKAGLLRACTYEGHRCFIFNEGNFAQARRIDGGMLDTSNGPRKSKNLLGSQGAFIGRNLEEADSRLLLVEGCIGFLEGLAAFHFVDRDGWTVIAATSASSRFARDPGFLEMLKGRQVRIVPDSDPEGFKAAGIWCRELRNVGATVDGYALPDGIKDLGPIVADPLHHAQTLKEIFTH